ncbi:MAG: hypothetical protein MJ148_02685 [Clostridia bacterium]|nr:hypothetical protein [Clostridia bacterium]
MILEGLVNGGSLEGKSITFSSIPEEATETEEKFLAAVYANLKPFYDRDQLDELNAYVKRKGLKACKPFSREKIEERKALQKKVVDNFSRGYYYRRKYDSHRTRDFGERYFSDAIMKVTGDPEVDLPFNQRVTDLIVRAQNGDFKPDSAAFLSEDPKVVEQVKKDKEDFVELHRGYLRRLHVLDLEKLATTDMTDEELADKAGDIHALALLQGQFDNIKGNFAAWGIEAEECSQIMDAYNACGDYITYLKLRLDNIYGVGYPYYDSYEHPDIMNDIGETDNMPPSLTTFVNSFENASVVKNAALNGEVNAIKNHIREMGLNPEDFMVKNPKTGDLKTFYNILGARDKDSNVTLVHPDHPEIELKFKLSEDMPYTRMDMLKDNAKIKNKAVPDMPQSVGWMGSIADWFTSLRTGHKPRKEAYEKQLKERNVILESKDLINNFENNMGKLTEIKQQEDQKAQVVETKKTDLVSQVKLNLEQSITKNQMEIKENIAKLFYVTAATQKFGEGSKKNTKEMNKALEENAIKKGTQDILNDKHFNTFITNMKIDDMKILCSKEGDPLAQTKVALNKYNLFVKEQKKIEAAAKNQQLQKENVVENKGIIH